VQESVGADRFELTVTSGNEGAAVVEELNGSVNTGAAAIKRSILHYASDKKASVYKFGLTPSEMREVVAAHQVTVQVGGAPQQSFAAAGLEDALRHLQECTSTLRYKWHVGRGYATETGARGDTRPILEAAVPAWLGMHMRSGAVQFILFVDETGKVVDCDIHAAPGAPLLEELGCELLRREATFQPARDAGGKAMKDNYWTPPVVVP
jgi:hypothetical protein